MKKTVSNLGGTTKAVLRGKSVALHTSIENKTNQSTFSP